MEKKEKGLPKYSIKGGICNEKDCMNICTVLLYDGIWRCRDCAAKKVEGFFSAFQFIVGK